MRLAPSSSRKRWRTKSPEPPPKERFHQRFLLIKALILVLFGVLIFQLARMQLVDHSSYDIQAQANRLRMVPELPARGLIYDRNGRPLVENQPIFSAAVVPEDVPQDRVLAVVAGLSEVTGVPPKEIADRIANAQKSEDPFTPLIVKENLDETTTFRLRGRQSDLPGVQVLVESVRHYLEGSMVAHYLGYVGRIDAEEYGRLKSSGYLINDHLGKAGVEYTYESVLRGTPGYRRVEIDAAGREVNTLTSVDPRSAGNVQLSLDLDLQQHVTQFLQQGMGPSKNAVAVVMNVKTGELLSMVSLPSYDDNLLTDPVNQAALPQLLNDSAKPLVNHAISEVSPPGSTFKQITGTAALQEGVANPNTTITSYGSISVEDEYTPGRVWIMRDWTSLGTMDFYHGLAMSSDVYFYYLSGGYVQGGREVFHGLGAERLARYAREYGLGQPTGVDLPGEVAGLVPDPQWKEDNIGEVWTLGDTYNFGIGQGYLTLTPMQLVRVTAAIANGGDLMEPHAVRAIVDGQGNVLQQIQPKVSHHVAVSDANLSIMREAMRQAAIYGPARTGASSQVTIAAKTGTAEFGIPLPDGRYQSSHAWYVGYAPFDNPEIAIVVFLERGIGATNGGPIAQKIFDYYFGRQHLAETNTP